MSDTPTITIPASVLASAQTLDDLEDWLLSHDPAFLAEVRQIRRDEDLGGQGKDLSEIVKRWPIES